MVKKLVIVLASLLAFIGAADTLFWQIDPEATVHYANGSTSSMYTFLTGQPYSPNGDTSGMHYILGARINVSSDPSAFSQTSANAGILRYMETESGRIVQTAANSPVNIGHPSVGLNTTGVSTDDNSIAAGKNLYYQISIVQGWHNQHNEQYFFKEIAWSALYQGGLLDEMGSYALEEMSEEEGMALLSAWLPQDYYTYRPVPAYDYAPAPEPNTCVLMLLGLGILALRRKKMLE